MDFEFSPEQELLRETVRRAAAEQAPIAALRATYGTDAVAGASAWAGLRDLGVLGLLVPEAHGGSGMGLTDAGVVAEELGRALHPSPWLSSCVGAASLVAWAGDDADRAQFLPPLADGSSVGTVAFAHTRRPGRPSRRSCWQTVGSAASWRTCPTRRSPTCSW